MADPRLYFRDWVTDLVISGRDLATDDGLESAVVISLFTDRRAESDDSLPAGETDLRGWWGDDFMGKGRRIGSKLWLLSREKRLPAVLARAKEYAEEALAWLVEDGLAKSVDVQAEAVRGDTLALLVTIILPDGTARQYRY